MKSFGVLSFFPPLLLKLLTSLFSLFSLSFLSLFLSFSLSPLHLKLQPPPPPPKPKKQQDLYAVNAYTTRLVSRKDGTPSGDGLGTTNYLASENTTAGVPLGPVAESSWLLVDPAGFGKLLVYLNKR